MVKIVSDKENHMTRQERSIISYMEALAKEIESCEDPKQAQRFAVELTRLRGVLKKLKTDPPDY